RFLLDAARGVRQPSGPAATVRPGLSDLLAQSRAAEKNDVARPAGDEPRSAGGRAARNAAPARRSAAPQPGVARDRGARAGIRRGDGLLGPRAAAGDGL